MTRKEIIEEYKDFFGLIESEELSEESLVTIDFVESCMKKQGKISEKKVIEIVGEMCIQSLDPDKFENWEKIKKGLESVRKNLGFPLPLEPNNVPIDQIETGVEESLDGHQAWFRIGNQTFSLRECTKDTEDDTLEKAKWYEKSVKIAFGRLSHLPKESVSDEEIEELSEKIHHLYCDQYLKDNGKPYWTEGDYSKLDEKTKEYDRNIAKWHIDELSHLSRGESVSDEEIEAHFEEYAEANAILRGETIFTYANMIGFAKWLRDRDKTQGEDNSEVHQLNVLDYKRFREMQNMSLKMDRKGFSEYLRDNWAIIRVVSGKTKGEEEKKEEEHFKWKEGLMICNYLKKECPINDTVAGSTCPMCVHNPNQTEVVYKTQK